MTLTDAEARSLGMALTFLSFEYGRPFMLFVASERGWVVIR